MLKFIFPHLEVYKEMEKGYNKMDCYILVVDKELLFTINCGYIEYKEGKHVYYEEG